MTGKNKLIRISAKIFLWLTGIFVFLFALVWLVLKVPSVQNFLVTKATSYVSNKTHTKVQLAHIDIGFPKSILLEGLFLEDEQHDTLLSLQTLTVDLNMLAVLNKNIDVQTLVLEHGYVRLKRSERDSTFNFQFLIDAFTTADKDSVVLDTTRSEPWGIKARHITLKDTRFEMLDAYGGMNIIASAGLMEAELDELNLSDNSVELGEIVMDNIHGTITHAKASAPDTDTSAQGWDGVSVASLLVQRSSFSYTDVPSRMSVAARIGELELSTAVLSLIHQTVTGKSFKLVQSSSIIQLEKDKTTLKQTTDIKEQAADKGWSVQLSKMDMRQNAFRMDFTNEKPLKAGVDWNHLSFSSIYADVKSIVYKGPLIKADIAALSLQEKSGFGIRSLEVKAFMDSKGAELSDLSLATNNSFVGQHIKVGYRSLEEIISSGTFNCSLYNNQLSVKDLLLLVPDLDTVEIIHKNKDRLFMLDMNASGSLEQLSIRQFALQTLSTSIQASGNLKHITDPDKLYLNIAFQKLQTGKTDLMAILPDSTLPTSVHVPASVFLKGNYKGTLSDFQSAFDMNSSIGNAFVDAKMQDLQSEHPAYDIALNAHSFDLGKLLDQTALGKLNGAVHAKGIGFDTANIQTTVHANIESIEYNTYNYHNLVFDGIIDKRLIAAKGDIADTNLIMTFDGRINLAKENQSYDLQATLKGADFYGLGLSKDHLSLSANADVSLKGDPSEGLNGHAAVRNILVIQNGKKYKADSLVFVSVNEPGNSNVTLNSSMMAATFKGNIDILSVAPAITNHLNRYFKFTNEPFKASKPQNFAFEIQLNDSPLLREVILSSLTDYQPMHIEGGFNSEEAKLTMDLNMPYVVYDNMIVKDFVCTLDSDKDKFLYNTGWSNFKASGLTLEYTTLNGAIAHDTAAIALQIKNGEEEEKLMLKMNLTKASAERYRFSILKGGLALQGKQWEVSDKNYIEFATHYLFADQLILKQANQSISLQSSAEGNDLALKFSRFNLHTFSQIAEEDTLLVQGILDGDVSLKDYRNNPSFTSELKIKDLTYKQSKVGDLHVTADNLTANRYTAKATLTDSINKATISGYYSTAEENSALNFNADIDAIELASLQAFSGGQLSESSGILKGTIKVTGAVKDPKFNGSLQFINAATHVAFINQHIYMNKETITVSSEKITFNSFNIKDSLNNEAIINGSVGIKSLDEITLDLSLKTDNFVVLNTTARNNKLYYGKVILDSKISVKGTADLPIVKADLTIGGGSHFTFAIPDSKVSVDRGDGIVVFRNDSSSLNPIMLRQDETPPAKKFTGLDISAKIHVDKSSTLKLLVDPVSGDSLSVRGNAALNFRMDPSGQTSLVGQYTLTEGNYKASLENLIVRRFEISRGSNIIWSGDPLDALVDIRATYTTKTAPDGLLINSPISDSASLRKPLPFIVRLNMRGELLKPVISFQLDMPDNVKGAIGGEVYSKITAINADESEVNKQVFALLVLNRFLAPESSGGGTSDFARRSVSRMMSNELNKLSAKYVQGLQIDVDVQSYNQANNGQGNTQVQLDVSKSLLDERLSIQVGGNVNVEGQDATAASNAKNFTGDVSLEYKLTKNGRYRLKGFRTNQYDNISNGTIVETGAGIMYIRNYTRTRELFQSKKNTLPLNR